MKDKVGVATCDMWCEERPGGIEYGAQYMRKKNICFQLKEKIK